MRKLLLTTAITLGLLAFVPAHARAADAAKEKDKETPASQPAEGGVIEATDIQKLKDADGKDVTVHGKIAGTYKGKSVTLINFAGAKRDFSLVIKKDNLDAVNAALDGDVDTLKDKTVSVTGKVSLYKDKPQIEITKPDQIKVEDKKDDAKKDDAKKEG